MNGAASIIADARDMFEHYLKATETFFKRATPREEGGYNYPEGTVQADCGAFAGIFTCLWTAIKDRQKFTTYRASKPSAFGDLVSIVTPDANSGASYAEFWAQKCGNLVRTRPETDADMHELCRTLRNGFCHFNFRYTNVAPRDYFRQLDLPLPGIIKDPDIADNFRIYILDWDTKNGGFLDHKSDTRIIETHFAPLRYHLFCFLARFFTKPGSPPYIDILTLRPLE
jgi:hypothetical protein